jgi:hypothetical protein
VQGGQWRTPIADRSRAKFFYAKYPVKFGLVFRRERSLTVAALIGAARVSKRLPVPAPTSIVSPIVTDSNLRAT